MPCKLSLFGSILIVTKVVRVLVSRPTALNFVDIDLLSTASFFVEHVHDFPSNERGNNVREYSWVAGTFYVRENIRTVPFCRAKTCI